MNRKGSMAVLCAGFSFTGLGCALPGVLLPALQPLWHWNDQQAGRFFLVISLGSSIGPLLLGQQLRRALVAGFGLAGAAALVWTLPGVPHTPFGVVWGLGLGMIMTSISLIVSDLSQGSGIALGRINFLWSVGACLCPLVITSAMRRFDVASILHACAGLAVLLLLASSLLPAYRSSKRADGTSSRSVRLPFSLVAATVLATGVEASAGAWLATYAARFGGDPHATLAMPSLFWGGLLLSRALSWRPVSLTLQAQYLRGLFALAASASLLLLFPIHEALLSAVAFALGFGLGPVYPELLARVLNLRQTRSVFFLAGATSAVLPWGVGVLSQHLHSLIAGMLIPWLGSVALLVCGWRATAHEVRGTS